MMLYDDRYVECTSICLYPQRISIAFQYEKKKSIRGDRLEYNYVNLTGETNQDYNIFSPMHTITRGGRFELPRSETNGLAIHRRAGLGHPRIFKSKYTHQIKRLCTSDTMIKIASIV